jgi:hypothetical protein
MITGLKAHRRVAHRASVLLLASAITVLASTQLRADTGTCNGASVTLPFTDVPASNSFFCAIAQAFFTGLTNGTSATTYNPSEPVTREQMAAFITRTQDSALKRGSHRAAAGQWATPQHVGVLKTTPTGNNPQYNCFDGEDIWVPSMGGSVTRVHASDGRVLGTWTGANSAFSTIAAAGFIYVLGTGNPGRLYRLDPTQAPGAVVEVENNLGIGPRSITYDGLNLWTANQGTSGGGGSITRYNIVTDTTTTFAVGFTNPVGIVFDGTHLWVADVGNDALYRVNPANGAILETLALGTISGVVKMAFDGSNIWVPIVDGLKVVSTSNPARLLATLTGNGLTGINIAVAFDGERILVTNTGGHSVSLWKASSLTPLGNLNLGAGMSPAGVCSDGLHFWISVSTAGSDVLMRF